MGQLGDLTVDLRANVIPFQRGLQQAEQETERFRKRAEELGQALTKVGGGLTVGVTLPIVGLGAAMIKAASDAEETQNKFSVTFQGIEDDAQSAATALAEGFGLAAEESQRLLADTGDLLTGFGFARDQALSLSEQVVSLGADLASFTNLQGGASDAADRLTKALLGETESAKALGIVITQQEVDQEIARLATEGTTFATERQAKATATLNIAMRQSQNAIGDFARSQDSFANQSRKLRSALSDLGVTFGQELLPLATRLVGQATELLRRFNEWDSGSRRLAIGIAAVAAAAGPLLLIGGKLVPVVASMVTGLGALAGPIGLAVAGLTALSLLVTDIVRQNRRMADEQKTVDAAVRGTARSLEEYDAAFDLVNDDINAFLNATDGFNQALALEQLPLLRQQRDEINRNRKAFRELEEQREAARLAMLREAEAALQAEIAAAAAAARRAVAEAQAADEAARSEVLAANRARSAQARLDQLEIDIQRESRMRRDAIIARIDGEADAAAASIEIQQQLSRDLVQLVVASVGQLGGVVGEFAATGALIREQALDAEEQAVRESATGQLESRREQIEGELELLRRKKLAGDKLSDAELERERRLTDDLALLRLDLEDANAAVDAQFEARRKQAQREEAQRSKNLAIFQAGIGTAQAIVNGLQTQPFVPLGLAMSILAGTLGAAQIAAISGRPLPALQAGGIVPARPGGTLAQLGEGGSAEAVIPLNDESMARLGNQIVAALDRRGPAINEFDVRVQMGSDTLLRQISRASRDGRVIIAPRGIGRR